MKFESYSLEKLANKGPFKVLQPDESQKKGQKSERSPFLESFESLTNLKEQYESELTILRTAGILEPLANGQEGIQDIQGVDHPIPSFEEVLSRCNEKSEILKQKSEQGFVKMLLVPFGMSLDALRGKYKERILAHYVDKEDPKDKKKRIPDTQKTKLFATKETPTDPDEPLELDTDQPLWTWNRYDNADVNGKLLYHPTALDAVNHGAKTKAEILDDHMNGWSIIFVEDMPNIPRANKGSTIGGRPQIDTAGTSIAAYIKENEEIPSPAEYLTAIQKETIYRHETGLTPEDELIYATMHLEETNQVLDDYQGNGSVSYNLGALFPASGDVPGSCWDRDSRRAGLGWYGFGNRGSYCGVRLGVRV